METDGNRSDPELGERDIFANTGIEARCSSSFTAVGVGQRPLSPKSPSDAFAWSRRRAIHGVALEEQRTPDMAGV